MVTAMKGRGHEQGSLHRDKRVNVRHQPSVFVAGGEQSTEAFCLKGDALRLSLS